EGCQVVRAGDFADLELREAEAAEAAGAQAHAGAAVDAFGVQLRLGGGAAAVGAERRQDVAQPLVRQDEVRLLRGRGRQDVARDEVRRDPAGGVRDGVSGGAGDL